MAFAKLWQVMVLQAWRGDLIIFNIIFQVQNFIDSMPTDDINLPFTGHLPQWAKLALESNEA